MTIGNTIWHHRFTTCSRPLVAVLLIATLIAHFSASASENREAKTGKTVTVMLPGEVPLELIRIPAGEFMMGSPPDERGRDFHAESQGNMREGPVHEVTFAEPFYMGKYPITQRQWLAVMGKWNESLHGHYADTPRHPEATPHYGLGDDYPVYYVTWHDSHDFVDALNEHIEETDQGSATFRLPSEAEWEYACRAGTETRFFFGDSLAAGDGAVDAPTGSEDYPGNRSDYMWYAFNSQGDENGAYGTKPVGEKKPNAWGLYDMHGNVWEWCADHRHRSYEGAPDDGSVWVVPDSSRRVVRGGSWLSSAAMCRSAARDYAPPALRRPDYGFRLVRE